MRDLFSEENFTQFLQPILTFNKSLQTQRPILLKLSPDISKQEIFSILDTSLKLGIDGWIISNTTTDRKNINWAPKEGGVSGRHLASISKNLLKDCVDYLGPKKDNQLVISCGGVLTPEDVYDRLSLGADLVQVYTALVFEGPGFFKSVAKGDSLQ